jgi:CubicO group peptidase (beta-lactamase class C family)
MLLKRFLAACLVGMAIGAHAADPSPAAIDKLFAAWDKPDTPGVALAVVRDGKIAYSRGYGQANLEYAAPITPATPFHVASLSKQFTAFAVQLLVQDGKLSLDDEVRKHLPELQIPGITVRQLMLHTSGLRDQWSLLLLAGLRMDDVISYDDILGLVYQQKQLNFTPGAEELYSNTGYTLMAQVVRRVSGQPFAAFMQERVFGPLGMKNTQVHDNYGVLVKGRAQSYYRFRDSWRHVALSYSNGGATSVFTTVEDLALWNNNFDDPRVGGAQAIAAMTTKGKLNSGQEIAYGGGLVVEPYRGIPTVGHGGSDAGFRTHMMRFAQPRLAVIVLGNASEINAYLLARAVADLYLEGTPGLVAHKTFPPDTDLQARDLAPLLGDYEVRPGSIITVGAEGNRLYVQNPGSVRNMLFALPGGTQFYSKQFDGVLTFPAVVGNEPALTAHWKVGYREYPMRRVAREPATAESVRACTGDYYSQELRTIYSLFVRDGKTMVRYPRGVLELRPINRDIYGAPYPMGTLTFKRDAQGACESFGMTTGRVRNLQFARVKIAP